ncbi:MAG TPA: hypothetical protein VJQ46_01270 [Gemmatimonadales bacterium]|nr:hypothetical protein [Gemmatimonadales bacterium]
MRRVIVLLGAAAWLAGCRGHQASEQATAERTSSPYSSGTDSGSVGQRTEGTNTGVEREAPRRIPGVVAALAQIRASGRIDQTNLTALRGDLSALESGMRDDLTRAGLSDTGTFHALADSVQRKLGGGAGGLSKSLNSKDVSELSAQVQRLIDLYNKEMSRVPS